MVAMVFVFSTSMLCMSCCLRLSPCVVSTLHKKKKDILEAQDRFRFPDMKKARLTGVEQEATKNETEATAKAEAKPAPTGKRSAGKG